MTTDPIADLFVRIKNAYLAKHQQVVAPHSKIKENLVKLLIENGYLQAFTVEGKKPQLNLIIDLKYVNRRPALTQIKRISKPGVRHYIATVNLNQLTKSKGLVILSTSKGIMTAPAAKKLQLGGEIICKIS